MQPQLFVTVCLSKALRLRRDISLYVQVGCWDGTVAVIRLQPSVTQPHHQQEQGSSSEPEKPKQPLQHDMVVLTHFQADPLPIRAVAWCPTQASK